jgi:phage gpG-like protein
MVAPKIENHGGFPGQKSIRFGDLAPWIMDLTARSIEGLEWDTMFKTLALVLERETKKNFDDGDTGHAPDGEPWLPLKNPRDRPRDRRARGGEGNKQRPLRDTGILMASLTGSGEGHVERIEDRRLIWGTNVDYAAVHQDGAEIPEQKRAKPWVFNSGGKTIFTRKIAAHSIPARPFLGINDDMLELIDEIIADFTTTALRKGKNL